MRSSNSNAERAVHTANVTRILTDIQFWVPLIVLVAGLFLLRSLK